MMKQKQPIALMLGISLAVVLTACGGRTADRPTPSDTVSEHPSLLEQIRNRGKIVIATEGDWSPWTYHDEQDRLTGLDVELGMLIAEKLGVEAEFQETDWDSILAGVDAGRFDIACNGVNASPERAEKYNFSTPYVYTREVLVVRKDNEDIHSIEDLEGRSTANSPNSVYAQLAEEAGAEVTYVNTLAETIQALEQGRVDATLNTKGSIADYLREHPEADIKVVYETEGVPVSIPTRKDAASESLTAEIDKILEDLRQSGALSELSVKYFGADLTQKD